ncbi:MAG: acriflavin resistance protein [Phycisphaerales bacterium]|nr:acriflavin resistance protein [Phycisphaerales bacterium]
MSLSAPFIRRPVGTTLLTIALTLAGVLAYTQLPVSPLPQVDSPTINVSAGLPGASPETMASAVATPLERQFGRIAGVTEMTSSSTLGSTNVTLQFELSKNIDSAAREVQAAINAARGQLPTNLPSNPTYRKVNPADAPIMILSLTSDTHDRAAMYDVSATVLQQKLSQVEGVGQVNIGGGALPAVRVDVNPARVNDLNLGLDDVRAALASANANRPKGTVSDGTRAWSVAATDQITTAAEYARTIVTYRNGAAVRVADVAKVTDGVEDVRTAGLVGIPPAKGAAPEIKTAISLVLFRQPGANIIDTVDRIRALLPELKADIPAGIDMTVTMDRTTTIRASVHDVQFTLLLSIGLVIGVVFVFLRDVRSTLIPSVAVPVSLVGTFGVMYLCGYSVDNLSLMAMTIATGFVVDDAIVVIENVARHVEEGVPPRRAAFLGAKEIGFTVVSMSVSLVAVFIPILLMGGFLGRLFREFAVVLSVAIGVSMVVSLTTTPMMCAVLLRDERGRTRGRLYRASERAFDALLGAYERTLRVALRHRFVTLVVLALTIAFNVYLYVAVPKGFFPQQDTGRLNGAVKADQSISSAGMRDLLGRYAAAASDDPAVENVIAFTGGGRGTSNTGNMFVSLKPLEERKASADEVIGRLRGKTARIPGGTLLLQAVQDIRTGGRGSNAQYQYTLTGDDNRELTDWAPKMVAKLRTLKGLADVDVDQQNRGLQAGLTIDRATASRLGITTAQVDATLYDAFGQRQVSTYYTQLNQYHVVMEAAEAFAQGPEALRGVYLKARDGSQVPLSAVARYEPAAAPLSVNHQGQSPAVTLSFNLLPGYSLGDAVNAVEQAGREIGLPSTLRGNFAGTAQVFQASLASQPALILAALVTVYIVLGVLYESFVHPITILSTLPSAGVGALLALLLCGTELSVIALIGIVLLIGIVKKNAIMMIDFALEAERNGGKGPEEAIFQACILRFRPILMTTMAALLGGLPLALGTGIGAELRRPLGISIVGGLIVSQLLTLYTTPVVYLYLDRMRLWFAGRRAERSGVLAAVPAV